MTELFKVEVSKSPKQKWREKHGIVTQFTGLDDEDWEPWMAWDKSNKNDDMPNDLEACGYGMTEDEALLDLTTRVGHWNVTEVKDKKTTTTAI